MGPMMAIKTHASNHLPATMTMSQFPAGFLSLFRNQLDKFFNMLDVLLVTQPTVSKQVS